MTTTTQPDQHIYAEPFVYTGSLSGLSGTPSDVLVFPPNWNRGVRFGKAWRTNIMKAVTGVEQRSALFSQPIRRIRYTLNLLNNADTNKLKRILFTGIQNQMGIPLWNDAVDLTAQAISGASTLSVSEGQYMEFDKLPLAVLLNGHNYEIVAVKSTAASQIEIYGTLQSTWEAYSIVAPLMLGRLRPAQRLQFATDEIVLYSVEAVETLE
jgi:hypothetical protein